MDLLALTVQECICLIPHLSVYLSIYLCIYQSSISLLKCMVNEDKDCVYLIDYCILDA